MNKAESEDFGFSSFKSVKRRAVSLQSTDLVKMSHLDETQAIPIVVQPGAEDLDLVLWAKGNLAFIDKLLLEHGAILFRDFNVSSLTQFNEFAQATSTGLMDYSEPSTARTELGGKVYTSTEYPASEYLPLHNEMSYSHVWPGKIWFLCVKPAEQGGETPIGDSRKIFNLIDPKIRERFIQKKVMYVRNYDEGIGLPWQAVFHTDSKDELEAFCLKHRIECEWLDSKRLRTRQIRQVIATHPRTGETVWFNQAHIHNVLSLPPAMRESLLSMVEEREFPLDINSFYGDGSPIEPSVFEEVRQAHLRAQVRFSWKKGDVMMLDNMLIAHARMPYVGSRKIVVAMAEPFSHSGEL